MSSQRVFLPEMRISFPHLFVPRKFRPTDTTARYQCNFLIPKGHPVLEEIARAIAKVKAEAFSNNPPANLIEPSWLDGDTATNASEYHPGHVVLRSASKTKPHVVDQNVQPVIDPGLIYSGCYVNGSINVYNYKPQPTPGITFGLEGVQFVRDGDRLDGRPTASQMFNPVEGSPAPLGPAPEPGAPAPVNPGWASTPNKPSWG